MVYAGLPARPGDAEREAETATWIAVIGFVTMMVNLFGVNLFFAGLHSYSGL